MQIRNEFKDIVDSVVLFLSSVALWTIFKWDCLEVVSLLLCNSGNDSKINSVAYM
jgi:hypothetical protein